MWGGELSENRYVLIFFNRAETSTTFNFKLNRTEFGGMKVTGIRDVIQHSDVQVPTKDYFTTKTVKRHGVANYIFTLGRRQENNLETM